SGHRVQGIQSEIARVQTGILRFPPPPMPPRASSRLESSRERRVSRFSFNLAGFLFFKTHLFLSKWVAGSPGRPPRSGQRRSPASTSQEGVILDDWRRHFSDNVRLLRKKARFGGCGALLRSWGPLYPAPGHGGGSSQ